MSKASYERINQKLRTRLALLVAARGLVERNEAVSIAAAAKAAGVSSATAYRYFSDPEILKAEAVLDQDFSRSGDLIADLRDALEGVDDVTERVLTVHRLILQFALRNEPLYRAFLARTIEQGGGTGGRGRGGRRIPMLELALEPMRSRMASSDFDELVYSLTSCVGYEPLTVLTDVCHLGPDQSRRIAENTLRRIVAAAHAGLGLAADRA